jgi:hemerythrin
MDNDLAVAWKDGFAIGDPLIDTQHQEFFSIINAMAAALEGEHARETVMGHYHIFVAHLVQHFRDEEALMERVGFTDLDTHNAEHAALLASVSAMEDQVAAGEPLDLRLAIKRLFIALVEHLVTEDIHLKHHLLG